MKKKSALLVSVTMVLVAVLALTTASFAWFTASMNPSVQSFDVNVTTGEALLVSTATDGAFKTTLTKDELAKIAGNNLLQTKDDKLNAATPTDLTNNKIVPKTAATTNPTYAKGDVAFSRPTDINSGNWKDGYVDATVAKIATGTTYHYVKFDIFFKASVSGAAQDIDVSLDLSADVYSATNNNAAYTGTTFHGVNDKGDPLGYTDTYQGQIAKVLRVAFVPEANATNATITGDAAKVYEPNNQALKVATIGELPSPAVVDTTRQVVPTQSMADVDATGKIVPQATNMPLFKLLAGKTAKMTVYIWIEGNDEDCVNEVSTAFFRSNIKFAGKAAVV